MTPRTLTSKQQGLVMVIALIMLLAVTLMVVAASNLVNANLKVVQNMEIREQARSAAVAAIEEAISNGTADFLPRFIATPEDIFLATCDGTSLTCAKENNVRKYDTNGDGAVDITVSLSEPVPRCVMGRTKLDGELPKEGDDYDCPGIYEYPDNGTFRSVEDDLDYRALQESRCGETIWDFNAVAQDSVTGAEVVVRQGVSVTVSLNEKDKYCDEEDDEGEEPEV